jgi:hypothetical protein
VWRIHNIPEKSPKVPRPTVLPALSPTTSSIDDDIYMGEELRVEKTPSEANYESDIYMEDDMEIRGKSLGEETPEVEEIQIDYSENLREWGSGGPNFNREWGATDSSFPLGYGANQPFNFGNTENTLASNGIQSSRQKRHTSLLPHPAKKQARNALKSILESVDGTEECISTARDLLIKAAHQAESGSQQTKILDLLNIFREYLEKDGNLPRDASVLTAQLQRLEQTTQALQTTARQSQTINQIGRARINQNEPHTGTTKNTSQVQPMKQVPQARAGPSNPPPPAKSWANIAGPSKGQQKEWTLVQQKKKEAPKPRKSNRVILIQDSTTKQKFSPLQVRDKINQAFRVRGVEGPVVAIVSSTRKENIALTTTEQYSAEFLMEKVVLWKNLAPHVCAIKDEPWFKVVIHGVPTTEFGNIEDLSSISEEIRVFNRGLKIIGQPYWI